MDNRRRILLVKKEQQIRFIIGTVLSTILLVNVLLVCAIFLSPTFLQEMDLLKTGILVAVEVLMVVLISYYSLIFSHRIAGSEYALTRDLKAIASGDLTVRTQLREGDYNMEVGELLRATTQTLCERMTKIKAIVDSLSNRDMDNDDVKELVGSLSTELKAFKTERLVEPDTSAEKISS